jgi:hypothetical protein
VPPIHNPLPQNWAALHFFGARALGQEAIFLRVSAQMSRKWGTTAELLSVKIAAKTAWNGDSSFPKLGIVGTGFSVGRYFLFDFAPDLRKCCPVEDGDRSDGIRLDATNPSVRR